MKDSHNIEQLFKEKLEHFEVDVNPNVWSNVQHGIQAAPGGGIAGGAAKLTIGKIIAGAASVALIAGTVWYFSASDNNRSSSSQTINRKEVFSKELSDNNASENQVSGASESKSVSQKQISSSLHASQSDQKTADQISSQNILNSENDETKADGPNTDNLTSAPQPAHKYGNASHEPSSVLRGNQSQYSQSVQHTKNSSSDNQIKEQAPNANIFASTESGDAPLTVSFSNPGTASALNWDFGDGSSSKENSPSHTFEKPGNYTVKLSAKNSVGNASDKLTIEVKSISNIGNIPNIFTPNGDGIDDLFYFETKNISSIEVTILTIGGNVIASWTSLDGKWDGKMRNGIDALEGNYLYIIQATGTDGLIHSKKGSITLKRSTQ